MDVTQLPASVQAALAGAKNLPQSIATPVRPVMPAPAANVDLTNEAPPDVGQNQNPNDPIANLANVFVAHLASRVPPPPDNGSFASKLAIAAKSLGGALGNAASDASQAASTPLRPGQGGALAGIEGALSARQNREAAEAEAAYNRKRQDAIDLQNEAKNKLDMALTQKRLDVLSDEQQDKIRTISANAAQARADQGYHAQNMTEPELQAAVQKDPNFLRTHDYYALPGKVDINGQQVNNYSVVEKQGRDVEVTQQEVDDIKANGGPELKAGQKIDNTVLKGYENDAMKRALGIEALEEANGKALSAQQKTTLANDLLNPAVQHAFTSNPADRIQGIIDGLKVANAHIAHGQQLLAMAQAHGDPAAIAEAKDYIAKAQAEQKSLSNVAAYGFSEDAIKEHETIRHNREEEAINRQKEIDSRNPNAPGGAMSNIPQSEGLKEQIAQLQQTNPTGAAILNKFDPSIQSSLMAVAFGDGSVDFKTVFPSRLYRGQAGLSAQDAIGVLKQINPNFSEQEYNTVHKAYLTATSEKNSQAIQQYNNFLQHSSEAVDALAVANRQGPRVWNMALNKMQNAGYGQDAIRIQSALSAVRGEIELLLSGGYSPKEEEAEAIHAILSDASTPGQLSTALQTYGRMGTVRLDNINENYKRVTGKNLPRIISPATLEAAKHLGLDPKSLATLQGLDSTGTIFGNQTITGANVPNNSANNVPAGMTKFKSSDGQILVIPTANLENAKKLDPKLQVIQ